MSLAYDHLSLSQSVKSLTYARTYGTVAHQPAVMLDVGTVIVQLDSR